MNKSQRARYFTQLWPAACRARGWNVKDDARRKLCTVEATSKRSTTALDQADITALFAYLGYLAGDAKATDLWRRIGRVGADAVNMQRQGEYHRDEAGYAAGGKLDFDRFRKFDDGEISPEMDEDEAYQYRMTMQNRARKSRKYQLDKTKTEMGPAKHNIAPDDYVAAAREMIFVQLEGDPF